MFILRFFERYKYFLLSLLIIAFSLLLRLYPPLDRYGLNMMEIDYIRWIRNLSGYDYLVNCVANHHGFLAPLLLEYWIMLMPEGINIDFFARFLSVIIFSLLIIMVLSIKNEEFDQRTKLISAFFISINGLLIAFSRNARLLPLFVFTIFAFFYLFYKSLVDKSIRNSLFLFMISVIALLVHPLSLIYIIGISLSAIIVFGFRRSTFIGFLPIIIAGVIVSPYYVWLFLYGKAESELLPINFFKILQWLFLLFDDIDTIFIIFILFNRYYKDLLEILKESFRRRIFTFALFSLIICLTSIIGISIFLPLTRSYYIIPIVVFSSLIIGFILSRLNNRILFIVIAVLSIKTVLSYCVLEKHIHAFPSSYGIEKEILYKFRDSSEYKIIDKNSSQFINLPLYYTRAFDYYKTEEEKYFPHMNKYGYLEDVLNSEYLISNKSEFYLILWDDCEKLMDSHQENLCKLNLRILDEMFEREKIWDYHYKKRNKQIVIFKLNRRG